MRVLVTGAAGFIGRHLAGHLQHLGHTVRWIDKRNGLPTSDLQRLTIAVHDAAPDVIVHLGASCSTAVSLRDPVADFTDNVVGTFNVCEAARRKRTPVLFVSSVKVQPGADGLIAPLGQSKRTGEDYLRLYHQLYGVPYIINRPSTVYGPGQQGSAEAGWVTWFLRAALEEHPVTVHGDGTQSRDILFVSDFVALLVDQVEHFADYAGQTYDVGGGPDNEVSLNELLAALAHTDVSHDERLPGDLQRVVMDNTKVTAVRGWQPTTSWREGVRATLEHMERHA
ncbi:NAD-dependent epimerase/dehydratase family protein [Streptomyces triculaminicus]|uniref:NAD-dependent epimerase/dehydratase family protein n=1 Tax=Streptomyces triculaminicus TaxID=2816232 RepID=A0A939FPE6_9ACTN|nr:NAD-dependent epimerase/dehydratase family protein [Streptomyces triculaminicus]MBO0654228.1 NAD-dependent epimerase/dehydratase family protein [Streptomyces triculaminicus]